MFKGNFYKIIKQGMSALLCGGLLFSQPGIIYASENTAAQVTAAPEHSSTYSQAQIQTLSRAGLQDLILRENLQFLWMQSQTLSCIPKMQIISYILQVLPRS